MSIPEILLTKENESNGILIVTMPGHGPAQLTGRRSFFFDQATDHGPVLNRFREWFDLWGIAPQKTRGSDTAFERAFHTLEWPALPVKEAHGPQLVPKIALQAGELLTVLKERRPKLVIFLSCYLWHAMNEAKELFIEVAGHPLNIGRRITPLRLAAYEQRWEKLMVLALPMPSKATTDDYVVSLSQPVQKAINLCRFTPQRKVDPLLSRAASLLALDPVQSVLSIRTELHVSKERAQDLFEALKNVAYHLDESGRLIVGVKKTES